MSHHPLLNLVNKCQFLKNLKSIHAKLLISASLNSSNLTLNKILRLYSRFGAISYAQKMFDEIPEPNAFLWTALVHGYVENQQFENAFSLFVAMRRGDLMPLNYTICSVLKALARLGRVWDGEVVYGLALKFGFGLNLMVQNAVIDMFMRNHKVNFARKVFDEMEERDVVSWNSMILGYGSNGRVDIARQFFDRMDEKNVISWTSLIQGYVQAGDMLEARALFEGIPTKDSASWNVMISGYIDAGDHIAAHGLFERMPFRDVGTWNLMLSGLIRAGDLEGAKSIFDGMLNRNIVSWVIMMDGYTKAGDVISARTLFDQMPEKNLIAWTTMIGGYTKNSRPRDALELYKCFKKQRVKPDETLVLEIISACSQLGVIDTVESVIRDFNTPSLHLNSRVVTNLVDMYAKCGNIAKALEMFKKIEKKDLLCYSTMITAFAHHGLSEDAISLFSEMQKNTKPDGIAFLAVLTACSHGGLVDKGRSFFTQMIDEYKIQPSEKHYACMVDLLGRAGRLEEAYSIINNMPFTPRAGVWSSLLSACRNPQNIELAEVASAALFEIEPDNSGNYILLSNVYAAAGRWRDVARVRTIIRGNHVKKNRGSSWIELDSELHEFVMGDDSHIDSDRIYSILYLISFEIKVLYDIFYVSNVDL